MKRLLRILIIGAGLGLMPWPAAAADSDTADDAAQDAPFSKLVITSQLPQDADSCETWTQNRTSVPTTLSQMVADHHALKGWILGYLTLIDFWVLPGPGMEPEIIFDNIDGYCLDYPDESVFGGTLSLSEHLIEEWFAANAPP